MDQNKDQLGEGKQRNRHPGKGAYTPERGRESRHERNSSSRGVGGISNRGIDNEEEQRDLPVRGSERGIGDQSER